MSKELRTQRFPARAAKLMEIKPHVKSAEARSAIARVDGWVAQVSQG